VPPGRGSAARAKGEYDPVRDPVWYTGDRLDWDDGSRGDEARVAALRDSPAALVVLRRAGRGPGGEFACAAVGPDGVVSPPADVSPGIAEMVSSGRDDAVVPLLFPAACLPGGLAGAPRPVYLGADRGRTGAPIFAVDLAHGGDAGEAWERVARACAGVSRDAGGDPAGVVGAGALAVPAGGGLPWVAWGDVRKFGGRLRPDDAAMLARANGLLSWHGSTRHCVRCGSGDLAGAKGGLKISCGACGAGHYPRVDPAVIATVSLGDWLLLGRKAAWGPGRYSCLAGFAEMGESLEDAVVREVSEEAGVAVDRGSVRFLASQPWPMPRSLMVGFHAEALPGAAAAPALSDEGRRAAARQGVTPAEVAAYLAPEPAPVAVDEDELQDARYFHADFLRRTVAQGRGVRGALGFNIPGKEAMARKLILTWLGERDGHVRDDASAAGAGRGAPDGGGGAAGGGRAGGGGPGAAWAGDEVPGCDIDEGGRFKYVLCRVRDRDGARSKLVVRGSAHASFHYNCFERLVRECEPLGLEVDVLGGGRIEHYAPGEGEAPGQGGAAHVYGYSTAFGPAPHEITAAIVRRWHPLYAPGAVSCDYAGY